MPAVKLNQRRVDALKPRKSAYDVRDRDLKGFGLQGVKFKDGEN